MTDHGRRDLISSWLDGRLSAEESARLEEELLHSRAARDEFRAWADLDSLLVQQAEAGQNNSGQAAQVAMPEVRRPWWIAAAAVIATVLVVWAVRPPIERPLATVTGTQFLLPAEPAAALTAGQPLAAGRVAILGGVVQVKLRNDVVLVLEGPGEVELVDEMRARLQSGSVLVRMPKGRHGFVVETATTDILDLGTEFAVKAAAGFVTDVQVYDGAVMATSSRGEAAARFPRRIEAGQAVRFSADAGGKAEAIPYRAERFTRRLTATDVVERPSHGSSVDNLRHFGRPTRDAIAVARATVPVVIDGRLDDWRHAAGFVRGLDGAAGSAATSGVAAGRPAEWVDGRMMYDDGHLYIAAHVGDPAPLKNVIDPVLDPADGWRGGGVQVRLSTDRAMGWPAEANGPLFYSVRQLEPTDEAVAAAANPRLTHLTMWYHAATKTPCLTLSHGMQVADPAVNPSGFRAAFTPDADGRGYVLEYAIPWRLLNCEDDPPRAGDTLAATWQVFWSDSGGRHWRDQLIEVRNPAEKQRVFVWERAATWGRAEYQ